MAATVHSLFVPAAPQARPPAAVTAHDALNIELRKGCVEILDDLARQMLDSADDALFKMSETAGSDTERRQFFDTMRVLRLERAGFSEHFSRAISATFDAPVLAATSGVDQPELSIQPTEELEERIAVGNLAARIEGQFGAALLDLRRRLDAARESGAAIPDAALTPAGICTAFGSAMAALRAEFDIKLIVYKLFERVLCRDFERLLRHGVETLEQHGYGLGTAIPASRSATPRQVAAPSPSPQITHTPQPAFEAAPMAAAMPDSTRHLFNLLLARLSANAPVVAAPMVQPRQQPLPPAMVELAAMAEELGGNPHAVARFDSVLESALAMTVHGSAAGNSHALKNVIESLRAQLRDQRQLLLRQIRGEVSRELDLRIAARDLPTPLLTLLRSGIGPLMAMRLLNGGRDSTGFRDADSLLDRLLDSLDMPQPVTEQYQRARAALLIDLRRALLSVGMSDARAGLLIDGLIASWAECDARLPEVPEVPAPVLPKPSPTIAATPPSDAALHATSPALLARVLLPETWFRVFDAARNQTRWLKVASYYAAEDLVRFTGIDDSTQLSLRASRLGSDLVDGRSEPISPSPDARAALDALRGNPEVATG